MLKSLALPVSGVPSTRSEFSEKFARNIHRTSSENSQGDPSTFALNGSSKPTKSDSSKKPKAQNPSGNGAALSAVTDKKRKMELLGVEEDSNGTINVKSKPKSNHSGPYIPQNAFGESVGDLQRVFFLTLYRSRRLRCVSEVKSTECHRVILRCQTDVYRLQARVSGQRALFHCCQDRI